MSLRAALGPAIDRAGAFLEAEGAAGFPEAHHRMRFPRWAGVGGGSVEHVAEVFAPAVIADLLVDAADLCEGEAAVRWRAVARRQADRVAQARLSDRPGGWSYFPDLPDLPPDLDSLGAAIRLFARAAPEHLPLVGDPIRIALAGTEANGLPRTWIIAPDAPLKARKRMRRGVRWHWGDTVDPEVCARFFLGLHAMDAARFAPEIARGAAAIAAAQAPGGLWPATWYAGPVYGTALCAELMVATGHTRAAEAGCAALAKAVHPAGGWGMWEAVPLDTAMALALLADGLPPEAVTRAVELLLSYQNPDGSWPGTQWIQMEVGRALGRVRRRITWQSDTVTTAFALRALLAVSRRIDPDMTTEKAETA
ncbi:prenyltransferase/squalene oxidase repeat-containing protein [Dinoroseobacter sp. S124A]|uniref:prenyltransferase/squalene oxidase repeat-containing protein n=1 Tax=Dinoroseobacter sp. S124A TaxID=3415128 RepID=UPI003C7D83E2